MSFTCGHTARWPTLRTSTSSDRYLFKWASQQPAHKLHARKDDSLLCSDVIVVMFAFLTVILMILWCLPSSLCLGGVQHIDSPCSVRMPLPVLLLISKENPSLNSLHKCNANSILKDNYKHLSFLYQLTGRGQGINIFLISYFFVWFSHFYHSFCVTELIKKANFFVEASSHWVL